MLKLLMMVEKYSMILSAPESCEAIYFYEII